MTIREWFWAVVAAVYLLVASVVSLSVVLSSFPTSHHVLEPVTVNQDQHDDPGHGDAVETYGVGDAGLMNRPVVVDVAVEFQSVWILGWTLSKPRPAVGMLILALAAGTIGAVVHAFQSLATFVGSRRFLASWTLWYFVRPPIGALLGLLFYFVLRAGLVMNDSGSTSPYGVVAIAALGGLFSKKALDKLHEVFNVLFQTKEPSRETDPLMGEG